MYSQQSDMTGQKRRRGSDDESGMQGFAEHRRAKRISTLAFRQSPECKRRQLPDIRCRNGPPNSPGLAEITPTNSDNEDLPIINEPKSVWSPYSSPVDQSMQSSSQTSMGYESSPIAEMDDSAFHSEDFEMAEADSSYLSVPVFNSVIAPSIDGRIPTPITCSFTARIRTRRPSYLDHNMTKLGDFAEDEAMTDSMKQSQRLPSPISEDEMSPGVMIQNGMGQMSMDVEPVEPVEVIKANMRPQSFRNLAGATPPEKSASGSGRKFTMGFRSDCEKCQNKVPGHFSHIITC